MLLLDCRPGDLVLDLGAGSGFSSEMMARLGYNVVALDPDVVALRHNQRRPAWDRIRIVGTVKVVQGIAERLPFHDAQFDGVLGMNVLHHVPDLATTVSELARVLKRGCRAVFVEPGLEHLNEEETQRAVREHGEGDRAFDVLQFLETARHQGFQQAMLTATLQSPLRLLPLEEVELYRSGRHPRPYLTPAGVLDELHRRHPYAMLVRDGERPKTSRHPGVLRCQLVIEDFPPRAKAGARLHAAISVANTGDTLWEVQPSPLGGFVTAGCKLLDVEGRLISDALGRTFLPRRVHPGESVRLQMEIQLPKTMRAGQYQLAFDLIDEQVCWFSDLASVPTTSRALTISW